MKIKRILILLLLCCGAIRAKTMYIKNGMNEQTLNNTVTIQGDEHAGGFVLVKRTGEGLQSGF